MTDPVNHPPHYCGHASGVECIEVTRWLSFNRGNAFKYIFRHRSKGASKQDLNKALWYMRDEIRSKRHDGQIHEYGRRALIKILTAPLETWEAQCYIGICAGTLAGLKSAKAALDEHLKPAQEASDERF